MDNPHKNKDLGIVDSGCSRSMTGNKEKLDDFVKIIGGTVTFGGGDGKITRKGTIRTSKLNFENVYFVEELQNLNLFSVSQICDKKNKFLFTDIECLILTKEFQLPENSQVVLRVPRRHNLYSFNLTEIQPERDITYLLAKASSDESTKWHRRMAMGELTFFLGLQVKQKPDGIFISQDKYVQDMLKKFDMESVRTATTPYEASKPKSKDEPDDAVNVHLYRSMIGSLMYLTASRPNIQFAVSACSRHQVTPLTSHLNAVKRIFKYLKGRPKLGLWYPSDSPFVWEAYSDSDYAGSHGDRKSTTGGCQIL
ncbi:hypothetical protein Tco_1553062, partial [Tanacetum coccineum]